MQIFFCKHIYITNDDDNSWLISSASAAIWYAWTIQILLLIKDKDGNDDEGG